MRTILVTATGGHLTELVRLRPRLGLEEPPTWVTPESDQTRTLLRGERIVAARNVIPRDHTAVARNLPLAWRLLGDGEAKRVISNGSGIALSFLPLARARGHEVHYLESAVRTVGPSMTGKLLAAVPGIRLYTQWPAWASARWRCPGSVFDAYTPVAGDPPADRLKVAVTLGTMPFPMRRLVERLVQIMDGRAKVVLWQTGPTPLDGLSIPGRRTVSYAELQAAFREADVVVSHAGIGSALDVMDAGRMPLLVPRRPNLGEHVDDHQFLMARELARRGLAHVRHAEELTFDDLVAAAGAGVTAAVDPPPIELR
ncbi:MAG: glycosyltransferase family 28 [Actinobacteria bacterium]|nr:MAG: glycosyltransferase family 28 [Actinomycetota bacterium]